MIVFILLFGNIYSTFYTPADTDDVIDNDIAIDDGNKRDD